MNSFWTQLPERSLAFRGGLLGLAVAVVAAGVLPVAGLVRGRAGLGAAALAAAICSVGAAGALVLSHLLRGPRLAIVSLLMGMAVRTGMPLVLAIAVQCWGGPLAEAGFLYYLLVFYPVTLGVETILSLPQIRGQGSGDRDQGEDSRGCISAG
ncbi:MAG: hypothetical protein ABR915_17620 [Thermoguttaceae bacterium]|jgi:hypothetical protein